MSATSHPSLAQAPLREAVFELRGKSAQSFGLIPGRLASHVTSDYPEHVETELAKFAMIAEVEVPTEAGLPPLMITHQFRSSDGKRLVQVGPGGVTVNSVAYAGFNDFRGQIENVLKVYLDIARPQSVARLGLRYLNHIPPVDSTKLLSALTVTLHWPPLKGALPTAFAARMMLSYDDPPGQLGAAVNEPSEGPTLETLSPSDRTD